MKSLSIELISTFRKQFKFYNTLIIVLCITVWVGLIFVRTNGFVDSLQQAATPFLVVTVLFRWGKNIEIIELLEGTPEEVSRKIHGYLSKQTKRPSLLKIAFSTLIFLILLIAVEWWIESSVSKVIEYLVAFSIGIIVMFIYTRFETQRDKRILTDLANDLEAATELT